MTLVIEAYGESASLAHEALKHCYPDAVNPSIELRADGRWRCFMPIESRPFAQDGLKHYPEAPKLDDKPVYQTSDMGWVKWGPLPK